MMQLDVASYRRVAERWASKDEDINPSMAAVLMLQMCGEIERLQKADYEFQEKLADGITNAFLERRWIPVSESLPKVGDPVLCCWSRQKIGMGVAMRRDLWGKVAWTNVDQWDEIDEPIAWMPLPEPPEVR
jgi:hypothetical protein